MQQTRNYRVKIASLAWASRLAVLLCLVLATAACPGGVVDDPGDSPGTSPFDGQRAYETLTTVVGFGPRPPGSEALASLRQYIVQELTSAGLEVRQQSFTAQTPLGPREMVNITGVVQGTKPGTIILGNHYDTKYFENQVFVGANDGGSTTAWMIEMARALGAAREGRTVYLCFFDGEEALVSWTSTDSLYGSRHYVETLLAEDTLDEIEAMINVDMIGDCDLKLPRDRNAPAWLTAAIWDEASRQGYATQFVTAAQSVQDDHIPFRNAGVQAVELIDFSFGAGNSYWHTPADTADKCCASSLQAVGTVLYHSLPLIDAQLDMVTPT